MQLSRGQNSVKENAEKTLYNISISGTLCSEIQNNGLNRMGVKGAGLHFVFVRNNDDGQWWHPVIGDVQHVTYDILDADGNFSFDFSYSGDLTNYNRIWLLLNTANDACVLPAPADGYIVWGSNGYTRYLNEIDGVQIQ